MDFTHFAKSRKSARGFLDKPVPKQVVDDILATAKWAPSSYNTQTWKVHAVTGETLDRIREGNTKNTLEGKPHVRDFPYKEEYEGVHRKRQIDVAEYDFLGLSRTRYLDVDSNPFLSVDFAITHGT
jgi:nitroreductase